MRHLTKGKGNSKRAHKPASDGVFPHVASPLNERVVSQPIWGMLPFCPICVSLSLQWEKWLETIMRVGKSHILGPKSHVIIAFLVGRILTVAMEIWNHECGPFWPNFTVFAIVCHIGITISPWGTGSSHEGRTNIVADDQGLKAIEFRICSSGSSGVIQLLVRSTIPPFAPHVAFCPVRVVIPSVNSKQPA